jgi:hypothetical protein
MALRPRRIGTGIGLVLLAVLVTLAVSACGSSTSSQSLYFVWRGPTCPKASTTIDTDRASGFTSWKAAEYAAKVETVGPVNYWKSHLAEYEKNLQSREQKGDRSSAARAGLENEIAKLQAHLTAYDHCTKYVKKGKPDPHATVPTY